MPICSLCNQREATQKNSHVLPHFLIKTAINKAGSKERDYELTFGLSQNDFVDTYFGRNITLETIKECKGREPTEEEMQIPNPFTKDFILCPVCEKNISRLEEYYSQNINEKLKKKNYGEPQKDKKENIVAIYSKVNIEVILLFVYSIFFRCSIGHYHGFRLNKKFEETLRKILFHYLDNDIGNVIIKLQEDSSKFRYFPVINTFCENDQADDPTTNFVTINHSEIPYFVYLNETTFQLYEKERHLGSSVEFLYGINEMLSPKKSEIRTTQGLQIVVFTNEKRKQILQRVFQGAAERQIKYLKKVFKEIHQRIFHNKPSEELFQYFMNILVTDETALGDRYSRQNVAKAMLKALQSFYQLPDK